jgi:hypothetical protein
MHAVSGITDRKVARWAREILGGSNWYKLRDRLGQLIDAVGELGQVLVGGRGDSFVGRIVDTLNYLTTAWNGGAKSWKVHVAIGTGRRWRGSCERTCSWNWGIRLSGRHRSFERTWYSSSTGRGSRRQRRQRMRLEPETLRVCRLECGCSE